MGGIGIFTYNYSIGSIAPGKLNHAQTKNLKGFQLVFEPRSDKSRSTPRVISVNGEMYSMKSPHQST